MLKTQQEKDLWHAIDYSYLSEISEHEEDDKVVINCHKIPWRLDSKFYTCTYMYAHANV